jgi:hypothetical protein
MNRFFIASIFAAFAFAANAQTADSAYVPEGKIVAYTHCVANEPIGLEGYTLGDDGAELCSVAHKLLSVNHQPETVDNVIAMMSKLHVVSAGLPSFYGSEKNYVYMTCDSSYEMLVGLERVALGAEGSQICRAAHTHIKAEGAAITAESVQQMMAVLQTSAGPSAQ